MRTMRAGRQPVKNKRFHALRKYRACDHSDTIVGSAGGIRREVCKSCGNVSVTYDDDYVPESQETNDDAVADDDS